MALPVVIIGPLIALAATGLKKGFDANAMRNKAELIGTEAKTRHDLKVFMHNRKKDETNSKLEQLGYLKVSVFATQIGHLVEMLKKMKEAKSSLRDYDAKFSAIELKNMESAVKHSLELTNGLARGAFAGGLAAAGATSLVTMLATASTGTAIATLSGAAATNATLAFIGGGTLASGGAGVAGGMVVLGGIAVAPAIAIAGFVMASKAEESLTKAKKYEAEADVAISTIEKAMTLLTGIDKSTDELSRVILHLAKSYDAIKSDDINNESAIYKMCKIGKALKQCLDQGVITHEGTPIKDIYIKYKGVMEL